MNPSCLGNDRPATPRLLREAGVPRTNRGLPASHNRRDDLFLIVPRGLRIFPPLHVTKSLLFTQHPGFCRSLAIRDWSMQ